MRSVRPCPSVPWGKVTAGRVRFFWKIFMSDGKIPGGYYLKARKFQQSWIAHAPPHVREIWDWLLLNANWKDTEVCKRGQLFAKYEDMQDGLHWMVGWRKQKYSKWDCEKAMKVLKKATMIATTKTTRGLLVTILNFNKYQESDNYESHKDNHRKATRKPQSADTILEEVKNTKKERKQTEPSAQVLDLPGWLDEIVWNEFKEHRKSTKATMTTLAQTKTINELFKLMQDGHDPTEVMNQSIANGWKGVFGLNDRKPNRTIPGMQPGMLSEKGQRTALNAQAVLERRRNERGEND